MVDPLTIGVVVAAFAAGKHLAKEDEEPKAKKAKPPEVQLPPPPPVSALERATLTDLQDGEFAFRPDAAARVRATLDKAAVQALHIASGVVMLRLVPMRRGAERATDAVEKARAKGFGVYASLSTALLRGECLLVLTARGRRLGPEEHFARLDPEPAPIVPEVVPEIIKRPAKVAPVKTANGTNGTHVKSADSTDAKDEVAPKAEA